MGTGRTQLPETLATPRCKMTGRPAHVRMARLTRTIPTGRTQRRRIFLSTPNRTRQTVRILPRITRTGATQTIRTETRTTRTPRGRRNKTTSSRRRNTKIPDTPEAAQVAELANTFTQKWKRPEHTLRPLLFPAGCTARGSYSTTTLPIILGWIEEKDIPGRYPSLESTIASEC